MKKLLFVSFLAILLGISCTTQDVIIENVITGGITEPTTWTADNVWIIDGSIGITSDLVIEPGTTVKFKEGSDLYVGYGAYGSIKANGTVEKPILFTSNAATPSAGDWYGINIYEYAGNKSTFDHCVFEYAGKTGVFSAALYVEYASISVQNTSVLNSASYGIYNYQGGFVNFSGNTIQNCEDYPLALPAQTAHIVTSDNVFDTKGVLINDSYITNQVVTWNALTVPYIITELNINDNGELTISAGATLLFKAGAYVNIGYGTYGKLVANGTVENPITLSSSASSPSPGDWQGINFFEYTTNGSILNNCVISYGGNNSGYGANVYSEYNASKLSIINTEISNSLTCGIYTYSCTPVITAVTYLNNANNECGDLVPNSGQ